MMKVLLVDDERVVKRSMRALIETEVTDFRIVAEAKNGQEALQAVELYRPDIVITDIRMPGMDGLALIRELKTRGLQAEFVIVSGYGDFAYAQTALRYGVTDYLLKPIDADYFVSVLTGIKKRISQSDPVQPAVGEAGAADGQEHPIIRDSLAYIARHYTDPTLSLKDAAGHYGISSNYFGTLFKKLTGLSFTQYVTHLRIEQAKRHLQKPFVKVYEVGLAVGFDDYAHFAKTFRKWNDCSPSEYRQRIITQQSSTGSFAGGIERTNTDAI